MKNTIFKCLVIGFVTLAPLTHASYSEINTVGDNRSMYNSGTTNTESLRVKLSHKAEYIIPAQLKAK